MEAATLHAIDKPQLPHATLVYVPPEHLMGVWPTIKHLVPSIIERSGGRHNLDTLLTSVRDGRIEISLAWDGRDVLGLMGTQIGSAPTGMIIATIRFAVGKDSHRWVHLIDEHEDNLRARGVEKIEIVARKGWERKLPAYKLTHVFLEKDL